jgi:hypothetical protein
MWTDGRTDGRTDVHEYGRDTVLLIMSYTCTY